MQYTANQSKRFREAIVDDTREKPLMFTMWDDLADNERAALLGQLHEHPIILAKRIAVHEYRGDSLLRLRSKDNERMLMTYTLKISSASPSSLNLAPIDDEITTIPSITLLSPTVQSFSVEGRISLPDNFQLFYMLACSECHFELNITDDSGTLTTAVSKTLGKRLLSMTAEQIYETVATKNELLLIAHIKQQLAYKSIQPPVEKFTLQNAKSKV
ncbi:hypothetical protein HAX54_011968 [Datura stramonium]|uniref:Uncharacterized protein n=1 Tax=Datura stramonium TaxID=4076 RepID=A0ABS8TKL4_DATST|nr:hypothetical protein [Datura stramonium]